MSFEHAFSLPTKYVAPQMWLRQNHKNYDHKMVSALTACLGVLCHENPADVDIFIKKYLMRLKLRSLKKPPQPNEQAAAKTPEVCKFLQEVLTQHELFEVLSAAELDQLIMLMQPAVFKAGDIILERGMMVSKLFVLESGSVDLMAKNRVEATLVEQAIFGCTSLITHCKQTTPLYAKTAVKLWALHADYFRYVVLMSLTRSKRCPFSLLRYVPSTVELIKFPGCKEILKQGEASEIFYIIQDGKAKVSAYVESPHGHIKEIRELGPQDFFGEVCLVFEGVSNVTITSVTKMSCYALSKPKFMDAIRDWYQ